MHKKVNVKILLRDPRFNQKCVWSECCFQLPKIGLFYLPSFTHTANRKYEKQMAICVHFSGSEYFVFFSLSLIEILDGFIKPYSQAKSYSILNKNLKLFGILTYAF